MHSNMISILLTLVLASVVLATPLASRQNPQGQAIHFNNMAGKCLDVRGAIFANGTPVQIYDCNETAAQSWVIAQGSTKVQVAGTNFCLDAGTYPADGVQLKIWDCIPNLPAQQWYYEENRIELDNQDFCVDLDNGITENSHLVQSWTCACEDNPNQIWTL